MDFIGVVLIAIITAIGGGTVRDLLLNNHPLFWFTDFTYLAAIIAAAALTQLFYRKFLKLKNFLLVFDALGLATFTVIGVLTTIGNGHTYPVAVIMGMITATVGGVIRDVLCGEIPLILHKEVYVTIALTGGIILTIIIHFTGSPSAAVIITGAAIFIFRLIAIRWNLSFPRLGA